MIKKTILSLGVLVFLFFLKTQAMYIENYPVALSQPDGSVIHCFISGDEYYNWVHDENNFTIIRNQKTGYLVYAILENGELKPSALIAGKADPAKAGLVSGINISPDKMQSIRNNIIAHTPESPSSAKMKRAGLSPNPNKGNINNIVIFIRFKTEAEFVDPPTMYDDLFNGGTGKNSLKNYFETVSYNTLHINTTFYPIATGATVLSYQDTSPRSYFQPFDTTTNPNGYKSNQEMQREHQLLKRAVLAVSSAIPAGLDLDYNSDGNVDNVCFVLSGATTAWSTLLWPHRWSLYSESVSINGKRVWDYNLQLRDFLQSSGAGVLCHEMFHSLGSPDLYHYKTRPVTPVGRWDIMASTANPPQFMGAFMKYKYGNWLDTVPEIKTCGRYSLHPCTNQNNIIYKVVSPNSATEYFILEYRVKTGLFENSLPGSGLIIYRINTLAGDGNANGPPDEIYIYRPHGDTIINGVPDSAYFAADYNKSRFNYSTDPKCFLSNGTDAGIDISDISTVGSTISFTVNFKNVKPAADFIASTTNTCPGKTIKLTDYSSCYATTWQWYITPATFTFVNSTNANSPSPQVAFSAPGNYTITQQVSSALGTDTKTKTNYITIGTGVKLPFNDDFESASLSTNGWEVNNPDTGITWVLTTKAKNGSPVNNAIFVNFFNYTNKGKKDEIISRNISLTKLSFAQLKFKYAYRRYNSSSKDSLKIFVSTNCGTTYDTLPVLVKTGNSLVTGANSTSDFYPGSAGEWKTDSVDLSSYKGKNISIKFQAINDHGNNLFLDNINITGYLLPSAGYTISDTQVCEKTIIHYVDTTKGDKTSRLWTFQGGDPYNSVDSLPSVTYDTPGVYDVTLAIAYKSFVSTKKYSKHIYIDSFPSKPHISWNYNSYTLTSSATKGNQWYDGNGQIAGATGKTYKVTVSGFYFVMVNNNGCVSESSDTLTLNTGIAELPNEQALRIYPNPSSGKFYIEVRQQKEKPQQITIVNTLGSVIYHADISGSSGTAVQIDPGYLQDGIYLIKVKTENSMYLTRLMICR